MGLGVLEERPRSDCDSDSSESSRSELEDARSLVDRDGDATFRNLRSRNAKETDRMGKLMGKKRRKLKSHIEEVGGKD